MGARPALSEVLAVPGDGVSQEVLLPHMANDNGHLACSGVFCLYSGALARELPMLFIAHIQ